MRVVLQRVSRASVAVDGQPVTTVGKGYVALVGIAIDDDEAKVEAMAQRTAGIRLFPNPDNPDAKPIDVAIGDVDGSILAVSQFTLCADTSRGRRPSFVAAARPEVAEPLFDLYCTRLVELGIPVGKGVFGAHMDVELVNDGPVTIVLDSR